jgi:hypothetical protein
MKACGVFLLVLLATVFSVDAIACGESLHRVGKGVSYRVYTAPLPGSVLVYAQSERAKELADALAQSGHVVRLVASEAELKSELATGDYDVVIASYSEHEAVESGTNKLTASNATFIPVASSREEKKLAKQSYDRVMLAQKDEIKDFLKAIHKTLKNKG